MATNSTNSNYFSLFDNNINPFSPLSLGQKLVVAPNNLGLPPVPDAMQAPVQFAPPPLQQPQQTNQVREAIARRIDRDRDPLGVVARQNAMGNIAKTPDQWAQMFAPTRPQVAFDPAAYEQTRALYGNMLGLGGKTPQQPDSVHTDLSPNIQRWRNPDGSANIMFSPHPGQPAIYGSESGYVTYPKPAASVIPQAAMVASPPVGVPQVVPKQLLPYDYSSLFTV